MKPLFAALLLTLPAPLHAAAVYSANFEGESIPAQFTGAGNLSTTGGLSAFGFGLVHLINPGSNATLMNLVGLAPHNSITLTFDLAMWDSIDLGSDQFIVGADGVDLYNSSSDFGNYFPGDNVGHGPGTLLTPAFDGFTVPDYGQSTSFRDSARHVTFTFPHSSENLTVSWAFPNSQGVADESFGIDNVSVDLVPEPSTMALFGLVLAGMTRRRR
jgi:hypothetical protein